MPPKIDLMAGPGEKFKPAPRKRTGNAELLRAAKAKYGNEWAQELGRGKPTTYVPPKSFDPISEASMLGGNPLAFAYGPLAGIATLADVNRRFSPVEVDPGAASAADAEKDSLLDGPPPVEPGGVAPAAPSGPTHATKTSTTVRKGIPLPFGPKAFMRASQQQQQSVRDQASAQAVTNQALSEEYMKSPEEREAAAEEYEEQRAVVQAQVQQVKSRLARMEADAAKEIVDPDRYWDNADIGKKMAYITAASDAGAAAAFGGGGPGAILNAAQRMITVDVNAQKSNIASAAGRRQEVRGMLSFLQRQVKDIGVAEALTYKRLTQDTADRLKGIALQTSSPVLKANAEAAAGALEQKAMGMANNAAAMMADRMSQTTQRVPLGSGSGGGKVEKAERRAKDALSGLADLDALLENAAGSTWEAIKTAGPTAVSPLADKYFTTRKMVALTMWKMFDDGKLSDKDLLTAMDLLKPKHYAVWGQGRKVAKSNIQTMRRRINESLRTATGQTISPEKAAAARRAWVGAGLPTR